MGVKIFFSMHSSSRLLLLIATMFPLISYNVPSIFLWYPTMFPQCPFDILQCPSISLWYPTEKCLKNCSISGVVQQSRSTLVWFNNALACVPAYNSIPQLWGEHCASLTSFFIHGEHAAVKKKSNRFSY